MREKAWWDNFFKHQNLTLSMSSMTIPYLRSRASCYGWCDLLTLCISKKTFSPYLSFNFYREESAFSSTTCADANETICGTCMKSDSLSRNSETGSPKCTCLDVYESSGCPLTTGVPTLSIWGYSMTKSIYSSTLTLYLADREPCLSI